MQTPTITTVMLGPAVGSMLYFPYGQRVGSLSGFLSSCHGTFHRHHCPLSMTTPESLTTEQKLEQTYRCLRMILEEPWGCTLCDSGVPRDPQRGHQPDCPYAFAIEILERDHQTWKAWKA